MIPGPAAPPGLLAAAVVFGAAIGWLLSVAAGRFLHTADSVPRLLRLTGAGAGAVLFSAVLQRFGLVPETIAYLVLAAASIMLAVIDIQEKRLPNALILPASIVVGVLLALCSALRGTPGPFLGALAGGAALFAVYLVQLAIVPRGMLGPGDVKLAIMLGLATGYLSLRVWLVGLVAAYFVNLIPSLIALALRRVTLRSKVPFGPAMVVGAFLAILLV